MTRLPPSLPHRDFFAVGVGEGAEAGGGADAVFVGLVHGFDAGAGGDDFTFGDDAGLVG